MASSPPSRRSDPCGEDSGPEDRAEREVSHDETDQKGIKQREFDKNHDVLSWHIEQSAH